MLDWILQSKKRWIRLSCIELGKQTTDYWNTTEEEKTDSAKGGGDNSGTWWGVASINHYRPITLNQRISFFSVLVKRIPVITGPGGIAIQFNPNNVLERGLREHQCWLQLFQVKRTQGNVQTREWEKVWGVKSDAVRKTNNRISYVSFFFFNK